MLDFLRGWICSLLLRHCATLLGASVKETVFKLDVERDEYSNIMASISPIDITSSDSENEVEVSMGNGASFPNGSAALAIPRKLPSWEPTSSINLKDGFQFSVGDRNVNRTTDDNRRNSFDRVGSSSYLERPGGNFGKVPPQSNPWRGFTPNIQPSSSISKTTASSENGSRTDDLKFSVGDKNVSRTADDNRKSSFDRVGSSNYFERPGGDFGNVSSQSNPRRALPTTIQPSVSTSTTRTSMENGGSSQVFNVHGKSHNFVDVNSTDRKDYSKDRFGRGNTDEGFIHDRNGTRLLPQSLIHGKSMSTSQSNGTSDPSYHSGPGEMPTENDERLIYQAALQNLSQPKVEANLPEGLLAVSLLKHQKIALAWMYQKETKSVHCLGGILADDQGLGKTVSMIALILMQRYYLQLKSTSDNLQNVKTEALNLDDDDVVGVSDIEKLKQIGDSEDLEVVPKVSSSIASLRKGRPAAGTLVVCPASVLRQWARELDDKVTEDAKLSVLIYHGGSRTKDPYVLAKYDVVLTTFAIVTNEVPKQQEIDDEDEDSKNGESFGLSSEFSVNKKRKKSSYVNKKSKKGRDGSSVDFDSGALARVGWFRVILDEAQTIKNHRTQVARACCGLRAKRRWCLSGTPIQNTIDDLYSYFRFLKYDPYAVYKSFCSSIKYPISKNAVHGYKKLQAVLKTIMLRRTKGMMIDGEPIINLPPKSICLTNVEFTEEERHFYLKLEEDSRSQFKAYAAAGTVNQNYASILLMLLRLRQACDHPLLVKRYNFESVGGASLEMARKLPRDMLINLLNLLEASLTICPKCYDTPEDAVVSMCGHVFCDQCVSEYLKGEDNTCPAPECKEQIGPDVVFSKTTLVNCLFKETGCDQTSSSEVAERSLVMHNTYISSKIKAALEILERHCKLKNLSEELCIEGSNGVSNSPEEPVKAIVFSQWTRMLDLVELSLNHSCIQYRRFDGKMTLTSRDKAVKDFNTDPEVTVMLMSLKAGNLGLNMVAASHVILLDLWWNPTTEDQAVDRAHRIGQTRPVTVSRITVKSTVEDRILALQEDKRKMVASAFGEDQTGGSASRLTVEDLRFLFMV